MADSIFLLQDDGELISMTEHGYISEEQLQTLLADYPELLSGDQINPETPCRWLLVLREAGIPDSEDGGNRWAVDHLFLDQDGIPTLVEVKRSSDTRIRREVVGQMLDYAANALVYWPHDGIQQQFEAFCRKNGRDPSVVLDDFLRGETAHEGFWHRVKENLRAQKVRLLFVADEIPNELQRIVEFLNGQMERAEVLAIEVKQFVGQGRRTLVPRVLGRTAESELTKGTAKAKRKWDEASFFEKLATRSSETGVQAARNLLAWASRNTFVWWGEGATSGSFIPIFEHDGVKHQLFAVYTYGNVEIYFQWYAYKPPFDAIEKRRELLDRLNAIPEIQLPEDSLNRRPSQPYPGSKPSTSPASPPPPPQRHRRPLASTIPQD